MKRILKAGLVAIVLGCSAVAAPFITGCESIPTDSKPEANYNSTKMQNVEFYFQTDKKIYKLGERVEMLYRVTNFNQNPVIFSFGNSQFYDFNIKKDGKEIWRWSDGKAFTTVITSFELDRYIKGSLFGREFNEPWNMADNYGAQVQPGNYTVAGTLGTFDTFKETALSIDITVVQ